jgi:hypothetical protein
MGLTMDVPGDGPELGGQILQQASVTYLVFAEGAGDGREGFDGNKKVGTGGQPRGAVRCEAPARDDGGEVRVVRELPAPGRQDTREPREVRPDATLVSGEPLEGERRGGEQGMVGEALRGTDAGSERLRDGKGEAAVGPGQLFGHVMVAPRRRGVLRTRRARPMATGGRERVWSPTAWAWIEAVTVMAAVAVLAGTDDLAVRRGERRRALQVFWRNRREELAEGGHGRRLPS